VSEREFTRLVGRSVDPSLRRKLWFAFPLTNAQLDLMKRKMLNVEWFGKCETVK